jgi:hypothetical protein
MGITLSSVALAISNMAAVASAATVLYTYATELMEAAEKAYATTSGAGATKHESVLASVEKLAGALNMNWPNIQVAISAFIESVKTAFNALKAMTAVKPLSAA